VGIAICAWLTLSALDLCSAWPEEDEKEKEGRWRSRAIALSAIVALAVSWLGLLLGHRLTVLRRDKPGDLDRTWRQVERCWVSLSYGVLIVGAIFWLSVHVSAPSHESETIAGCVTIAVLVLLAFGSVVAEISIVDNDNDDAVKTSWSPAAANIFSASSPRCSPRQRQLQQQSPRCSRPYPIGLRLVCDRGVEDDVTVFDPITPASIEIGNFSSIPIARVPVDLFGELVGTASLSWESRRLIEIAQDPTRRKKQNLRHARPLTSEADLNEAASCIRRLTGQRTRWKPVFSDPTFDGVLAPLMLPCPEEFHRGRSGSSILEFTAGLRLSSFAATCGVANDPNKASQRALLQAAFSWLSPKPSKMKGQALDSDDAASGFMRSVSKGSARIVSKGSARNARQTSKASGNFLSPPCTGISSPPSISFSVKSRKSKSSAGQSFMSSSRCSSPSGLSDLSDLEPKPSGEALSPTGFKDGSAVSGYMNDVLHTRQVSWSNEVDEVCNAHQSDKRNGSKESDLSCCSDVSPC